jgi:CheY-like chemotaxis protein
VSAGRTILLVEDEPLIAMMLEDFLESMGHIVTATVDTVADALAKVAEGGFEVAIVDIHLKGGEHAWPVADALAARSIPFILATGGHIDPPPPEHADVPVLAKPFTIDAIDPLLAEACGD